MASITLPTNDLQTIAQQYLANSSIRKNTNSC